MLLLLLLLLLLGVNEKLYRGTLIRHFGLLSPLNFGTGVCQRINDAPKGDPKAKSEGWKRSSSPAPVGEPGGKGKGKVCRLRVVMPSGTALSAIMAGSMGRPTGTRSPAETLPRLGGREIS